jgi:hypothetical protein
MPVSWYELSNTYDFVNSDGGGGGNSAYLCKQSGHLYWHSEFGDDVEELPDDIDDPEKYIAIPGKRDLGLGEPLVMEFTRQFLPDDYDAVRAMFGRRGAYARFKDLLAHRRLVDQWHDFEAKAEEKALREWCELHSIEVAS